MEYHLGRVNELRTILQSNGFKVYVKEFSKKTGILEAYKIGVLK